MLLLENTVPRMGLLENLKLCMWLAIHICWLLSWRQQMLRLLNPSVICISCQLLYGHCPLLPACTVRWVSETWLWLLAIHSLCTSQDGNLISFSSATDNTQLTRFYRTGHCCPSHLLFSPPGSTHACLLVLEICQFLYQGFEFILSI